MPIVAKDGKEANDTFIEQLVDMPNRPYTL
jgi:hypothetical protein